MPLLHKAAAFLFFACAFAPTYAISQSAEPFAVVELFTSQGCSSCPPADLLLNKLALSAQQGEMRLYPISFHVDYWNALGWRDTFSQKLFTDRQWDYAASFSKESVATPSFIVNGVQMIVSSDAIKLQQAVNEVLNQTASAALDIKVLRSGPDGFRLGYVYQGMVEERLLCVALVQNSAQVNVASGENAGRLLKQNNVVRSFKAVPLKETSAFVDIDYVPAGSWNNYHIVAFVQDAKSFEIVAAGAAKI